jgi:paraquat-inducible protein A
VRRSVLARSNARTAGIALAGLVLYPFAIALPMLEISKFGQRTASSILGGTTELLAAGEWFVGGVIFVCSIVLPFTKLAALLAMTLVGRRMHHRHRAMTYRVVEWTGRWGMLDVLLVAILVGVLKLGDIVSVATGPGAFAFTVLVVLSLLASASFDPRAFWEAGEDRENPVDEGRAAV